MPKLETIEADSLQHLRERSGIVSARRVADDADGLALCIGVAREPETEETDDLGRSRANDAGPSSGVRRARRSERDTRRARRKARSEKQDEEGFSTDGTLVEGDERDFKAAQRQLDHRVYDLLDDVKAEDFRDPSKGLAVKFGDWRRRYEEEYVNAFGGLAMVQAWEFWARAEMVGWEPFRVSCMMGVGIR